MSGLERLTAAGSATLHRLFGILLALGFAWIDVAIWLRTWKAEGQMPPSPAIRIAGVTYIALGLGFGVGALVALASLARNGELPMTPWGFRALSGPFERLTPQQSTALGLGLVGVCALDVIAGVWLWQGRQRGANLGLATTPPALALGAGFALPFLLAGVPIRVALVLVGRRTLR